MDGTLGFLEAERDRFINDRQQARTRVIDAEMGLAKKDAQISDLVNQIANARETLFGSLFAQLAGAFGQDLTKLGIRKLTKKVLSGGTLFGLFSGASAINQIVNYVRLRDFINQFQDQLEVENKFRNQLLENKDTAIAQLGKLDVQIALIKRDISDLSISLENARNNVADLVRRLAEAKLEAQNQ